MDQSARPPSVEATSRTTDNAIAIAAIAVLIVSYAVNAMDRTLFPLMLTDVRREYGFSLPQGGLLSTVFTLGMTLAGIPTGYLMSRYSRKAVIQIGILIYSAATVITVIATGFQRDILPDGTRASSSASVFDQQPSSESAQNAEQGENSGDSEQQPEYGAEEAPDDFDTPAFLRKKRQLVQ